MNNIVAVKVVDSAEHLLDGLRSVLLCELALLADAVEQLSTGRKLRDDVVLIPGLEPVDEAHDGGVLEALQHVELVVDHLLVALDVLLQDDLDGHLAGRAVGLADDAIGTGTERLAESVFCLLVVTVGLALKAAEHPRDCRAANKRLAHSSLSAASSTAKLNSAVNKERGLTTHCSCGFGYLQIAVVADWRKGVYLKYVCRRMRLRTSAKEEGG